MSKIRLYGATSGYAEIAASATAGDVTLTLPSSTAVLATESYVDAEVPDTTDDLTEGSTNLYYTDARADSRVAAGITNLVEKNNRSGQFFATHVERNGTVTAGQFYAFGNGSATNFAPVTYSMQLVGISLWYQGTGTLTLQVNKNGTAQGASYQIQRTGTGVAAVTFATPLSFSSGDYWSIQCITNTTSDDRSTVEVVGRWT